MNKKIKELEASLYLVRQRACGHPQMDFDLYQTRDEDIARIEKEILSLKLDRMARVAEAIAKELAGVYTQTSENYHEKILLQALEADDEHADNQS